MTGKKECVFIPTIDCSLQTSPIEKGKRKTALAVAFGGLIFLIKLFLHAGTEPVTDNNSVDSSEEGEKGPSQ